MPDMIVQPPIGEPVSLSFVKTFVRETSNLQDAVLRMNITAAREMCESRCGLQLLHARRRMVIDKFPMAGVGTPLPFCELVNMPGFAVLLEKAPVVNVTGITYVDMGGNVATVDPGLYIVNNANTMRLVSIRFGQIWPIPLPQIASVQIDYNAGYASPFTVVSQSAGTIKVRGPVQWAIGDTVEFYNAGGGALPAGLNETTPYTVASAAAGVYTVKDLDGNPVVFTDTGSDLNFMGVVPAGLRYWISMRAATMEAFREEEAILNRGKVEQLPHVDSLLWAYNARLP